MRYVIVEQTMMGQYRAKPGLSFATEEAAQAHIFTKYPERFHHRYRIETRPDVKAEEPGTRMTCQCCNRGILAKQGRIAHHGYTRPGHGWQTASCFGARRLPWEADRSALGDLIAWLENRLIDHLNSRQAVADERLAVAYPYTVYNRVRMKSESHTAMFSRDTFEAVRAKNENNAFKFYESSKTFDDYKKADLARRDVQIKHIRSDLVEFKKRYDSWVQTHKWENKTWVAL